MFAFLSDIEESPKWKVLSEILDEIKTDSESAGKIFSVIILSWQFFVEILLSKLSFV